MFESSKTIKPYLEVPDTSSDANDPSGDTDCILEGISKVTPKTPGATTPGVSAVSVFGIDLTEYIRAPSNDSPLERFLKDENRLGEMASSPWVCRIHKL